MDPETCINISIIQFPMQAVGCLLFFFNVSFLYKTDDCELFSVLRINLATDRKIWRIRNIVAMYIVTKSWPRALSDGYVLSLAFSWSEPTWI